MQGARSPGFPVKTETSDINPRNGVLAVRACSHKNVHHGWGRQVTHKVRLVASVSLA